MVLLWSEVWRVRVVEGFDRRAREVDLLLVILESAAGGRNVRCSVGLTMEQTDIYIRIGKSWIFFVKKCFFGNFFWTVPF